MKVGFIGLGKMGAGICSNIVKNGIDVVVYDINPANMQKFVDMGASSAATVKELAAQVDVCITCVPMPKDAKGVLLGPDGVFENLPEGGVHFDLSTLDIETVVMLEAEAAKLGKKYLVIPMGKGPAFAADGTCPLFGGGFWDSLSAFFCGLAVGACLLFGGRWLGSNSFLRTLVCSGIASLLSLLLVRAGLGNNVDLVTIGVLMLLVPGVALTNAMREIVAGDTYSGLSRTAEAILIATGIALGAAVGLGIGYIL